MSNESRSRPTPRNQRSRDAIARIGAQFEGIRRAHCLATDGTIRDSAYFSIVAKEWPAVKAALVTKLRPVQERSSIERST